MNKKDAERVRRKVESRVKKGKGGCLIWQGGAYRGARGNYYPTLYLHGKIHSLRRLVYLAYDNEPALGDKEVKSTCGDPTCVNPQHLIRGPRKRNGRPASNEK